MIARSGGKHHAIKEADAFFTKLEYLRLTGRYELLQSRLLQANDKSNFLALALEVNFAYQFEYRGLALIYEIKQNAQHGSSVDFLWKASNGYRVFFELRLLQQMQFIAGRIKSQLQNSKMYQIFIGGQDEAHEVVRIQKTILAKVQDKKGNPIKFFSTAPNVVSIVVLDVTDNILGAIDINDCLLATYGDPGVEEMYHRQVFGLFQEDMPKYPQHIRDLATRYAHIRRTLHGVLFLFKKPNTGILAYQLEQYLIWNPALMTGEREKIVCADICRAIPVRSQN